MNIYANEGDQVRFVGKNGLPSDLEKAEKHLKTQEIYTVECVLVGHWSSTVFLKEIPDVGFNSVCFEDVNRFIEEA